MLNGPRTKELITSDPDVLGGTPVFAGTRVPVETLIDYLAGGNSLEAFLSDFPTVTCAQAIEVLEESIRLLISESTVGSR